MCVEEGVWCASLAPGSGVTRGSTTTPARPQRAPLSVALCLLLRRVTPLYTSSTLVPTCVVKPKSVLSFSLEGISSPAKGVCQLLARHHTCYLELELTYPCKVILLRTIPVTANETRNYRQTAKKTCSRPKCLVQTEARDSKAKNRER